MMVFASQISSLLNKKINCLLAKDSMKITTEVLGGQAGVLDETLAVDPLVGADLGEDEGGVEVSTMLVGLEARMNLLHLFLRSRKNGHHFNQLKDQLKKNHQQCSDIVSSMAYLHSISPRYRNAHA